MIPVSLRLRNFMCYREGVPPLDLGDLHIACLSGPNGAGKSTILDAITWALWGRARSRYDDDLITIGAQEMEVEFEFLLEGNHYRVLRRRERGGEGHRGKTVLDLQVYGPLGWRSLGEESIRQTQQRIVSLLRMDYDTFINASFLLQGRADEFTIKPPAERKRVLADILGLSYYDILEQRAREQMRAREREAQALRLLLDDLEAQLSRRQKYETSLEQAQQTVQHHEQETARLQEELARLQEQITGLRSLAEQAKERRRRLAEIEGEIGQLEEKIRRQQARIEGITQLLERAEAIEANYARLLELRERAQQLAQSAGRLLSLTKEHHALEQAIERARSTYTTEREVLRRSLNEIALRLKEQPTIETRLDELRHDLEALQEKEAQREALLAEIGGRTTTIHTLKAECQRLRQEMQNLRDKLDLLEESTSNCPLCQSPLGPDELEHIRLTYRSEGQEKRDLYRAREARIRQLEEEAADLTKQQQQLEKELARMRPLERQLSTLEQDLQRLRSLGEEEAEKRRRLLEIEQILAEGDYAASERARLLELQHEIAAYAYDQQEYQAVQEELEQLRPAEEEHRRLRTAREQVAADQERLRDLQETLRRRRREAAGERDRLQEIAAQAEELAQLEQERQRVEDALARAQNKLAQARLSMGAAQAELERLNEVQQTFEQKTQEYQRAVEERDIFGDLTEALGKRGVQAMLIETAVPEIEREANALLQRMTGGEMSLQLAMQRVTKGGTISETLDINISDPNGTRPYDSYSGGERFRINFALRIALSRLLARRAGASLQTLVIDEGFGTQDEEGQERLVEAIQSVQDEFARILVITHIPELKERFPARIEVHKTPEGSMWTIL